jgi:inner membrane transporter RhtA
VIGIIVLAQIPNGRDVIGVLLVMLGVAIHRPAPPEASLEEA